MTNLNFIRNHHYMFDLAEKAGWKKHGKFTRKNQNTYQCFRKGHRYMWIGYVYIENSLYGHALDYRLDTTTDEEIQKYLI